ncbi:MAG: hypothetical protein HY821_05795 [Acidobacteria bacterium]|nr:hypothetical protein [Acidobacteriota bacterium]
MRRSLIALIFLALLTAGFYWKLTRPLEEYVWFDHPDMVGLEIPRLDFQAREFHLGRFPLWDPHLWMGQPLIGQTQPGPIYPLNLLMLAAPLDENKHIRFTTLNWYFIALHFIAAVGAYLLCRGLKRSRTASLLGAAAFSFAGFTGSVAWLDVLNGAIWIPFIAHHTIRAMRENSPRQAGIAGLFMGVAWLSGHHEIPLLTSLAVAAAWLLCRRLLLGAMWMAVTGLIAAGQMLPTIEFGRLAQRWGPANGPVRWEDPIAYLSATVYSLTPRNLAGIVIPGHGTNADSSAFLGIVTVALAALAIATMWRLRTVRGLALLAGGAAIFALGAFTPIHGWLSSIIPMLSKARVPSRAVVLLDFALVVLAVYGADQFLRGRGAQAARRIGAVAGAVGALTLVAALIFRADVSDAALLSGFVGLGFFAVERARGRLSAHATAALLFLMMLTEWHLAFTKPWKSRYEESGRTSVSMLRSSEDVAAYLRKQPGATRVRVNDRLLPFNFGDYTGIDQHEGYAAGVTSNLLEWGRHTEKAQRMLAITHYVGREPDLPTLEPAWQGQTMSVFRVTDPLPRARAVHLVESVPSTGHLSLRIGEPSFDPATTAVLVNEGASLESCGGDAVAILSYAPNRVRLQADMKCRGLVILADTDFPGWQAAVDGQPAKIVPVYGALRGVVASAGRHEIDFRYRPQSVYVGGALLASGLGLALLLSFFPGRSRTRRRGAAAGTPDLSD